MKSENTDQSPSGVDFPLRLLAAVLVITVLIVLFVGALQHNLLREQNRHSENIAQMLTLRGEILQFDEVLTMSARMATETGDQRWVMRYLDAEPRLDASIKQLEAITAEYGIDRGSAQTDAANLALVALEHEALDLLRSGQVAQARQRLNSSRYQALKTEYISGMAETLAQVNSLALDLGAQRQRLFQRLQVITAVEYGLIALLWVPFVRSHRRWRHHQITEAEQSSQRNEDLRAELSVAESKLAHILDLSPSGTAVVGANDEYLYTNRRYCELIDTQSGASNQPHGNRPSSRPRESQELASIWRNVRGGKPFVGEVQVRDGVGEPRWLRISAAAAIIDREQLVIVAAEDLEPVKIMESRLATETYSDKLTGLDNLNAFRERLSSWLAEHADSDAESALIHLNIDHFRRINDGLGAKQADKILIAVAARLKSALPENVRIGRPGGDDFLIHTAGGNRARYRVTARQLLQVMREPFDLDQHRISLTCSIGIAVLPADGSDAGDILRAAEGAAKAAKRDGRDCIGFAQTELSTISVHRLALENRLRAAIAESALDVHYQPLISLTDNSVYGAEALLRWQDSELGSVSPNEFIPVAEDLNLTGELAQFVFNRVCTDIAVWNKMLDRDLAVAINCSAPQLTDESFLGSMLQCAERYGISTKQFELEVTERMVMIDSPTLVENLHRLSNAGFRLAIDDFGTGYSSLAYLRKYPFHTVKIDRSFIADVTSDSSQAALCKAIIGMAEALGLDTVAEGLETPEQVELLKRLGSNKAQGWHYAAAMPSAEFMRWIKNWKSNAIELDGTN